MLVILHDIIQCCFREDNWKSELSLIRLSFQETPIWFYYKSNRVEFPIADKSWQTHVQTPGLYLPLTGMVIKASIHGRTEVVKLVDPLEALNYVSQSFLTVWCCFSFKRNNQQQSVECIHWNMKKSYSLIGV